MLPDLKSSTSHSKMGQYTSTETSRGNRTPTPTYTVQDNTNTGQTCTGQRNKLKDVGTRLSKLAKTHSLKCRKGQTELNAHLLKRALKLKHTRPSKDWDQYNQQRRPENPEERIDTLTQARTRKKGLSPGGTMPGTKTENNKAQ